MEEDIQAPMFWSAKIEDTTISPYSDKLLMFEVSATAAQAGIGYYGRSIASVQRRDLGTNYIRVLTESLQYGEDGANITIKNGWLEEPPQVPDNRKKVKK
ncbi:nitrogen fixation protein [Evansella vedderi]|uniref:Nitrogen fixation protein n=2 Tax=Evansella vedderi TaxID=38282 RepID=A0ABT9ZPX7_9BACI|nr:nitrogen fixation protein [Evansella vedderi]